MSKVVPSVAAFRMAVENIQHKRNRLLIQAYYLLAARASELVTVTAPYDLEHGKSHPYGTELSWELTDYAPATPRPEDFIKKALVFKIRVAKRKKTVFKSIGLPCDPRYEPWTEDLLRHINQFGTLGFSVTRQHVWYLVKKNLRSLDPDIHTHSLRHYRLTHLVEFYGFDDMDLIVYAGWTFQAGIGGRAAMLDTYIHLDWRRYFPKLLRPLRYESS